LRLTGVLIVMLLLTCRISVSAASDTVAPPAPVLAADNEKSVFCKDAVAHHLPELVAEAAATELGHGFHFDSYQAIPVAASDDASAPSPVNYRVQVTDDQNQAREIRVSTTADGHPNALVKAHWMCWVAADTATAQRLDPSQQNSQEAKQ